MTEPSVRFHVALSAADRPVVHGWWGSEAVARSKFTRWVGDWGRDGVRVVLVDEEMGRTLETWPGVVGNGG